MRESERTANEQLAERAIHISPMVLNDHERQEWSRCAKAMYSRGQNALGHLLSACAAKGIMPIEQFNRAASVYRAWLVFDEPK